MSDLSPWLLLVTGLTFFLAGIVKGVTGMGLPTVAMGVLGAIMPPVAAAALLVVPSFVTNLWQLLRGPGLGGLARRFWPMMVGIVAGTLAGSSLLAGGSTRWTTAGLGLALVAYAAFALWGRQPKVPSRLEGPLSPAIGLATGLVTGGTGVFVIPAVPYLQALGLPKDDLIQALGLSFTVSTIALAAGLAWRGAFALDGLALSALAVAPALAGMWLGGILRGRVSPTTFRRWFLAGLLLLGVELFAKAVLRG
ncbi:sulfite exporter TauE/SafE family protein [Microvirga pudoricolor]|uniref:sulfite exporter TauE/SafE family protein n=1 Tax=Microvirga pudoricolor TaxID=2778729 RepID=UPI00194E71DF|nr:sulfite exporter TauE/SafE family protein [Microvirga pudoricolor]MBM6595618.1 sulfite exporter TauE/SafE family protein [Microvirga pudoricolor]